jgi:hypothetical protein
MVLVLLCDDHRGVTRLGVTAAGIDEVDGEKLAGSLVITQRQKAVKLCWLFLVTTLIIFFSLELRFCCGSRNTASSHLPVLKAGSWRKIAISLIPPELRFDFHRGDVQMSQRFEMGWG